MEVERSVGTHSWETPLRKGVSPCLCGLKLMYTPMMNWAKVGWRQWPTLCTLRPLASLSVCPPCSEIRSASEI